jgi:site-specific DNA-methyltransferase (adenine-specific)
VSLEYRIGDVVDRLAEIPDGSIDLVVTSPPFLALRSYLPADHPDKAKEIGSEPTPAAFIDTLLGLSAEFARVLAPHGSICVELGDTFAGQQPGTAASYGEIDEAGQMNAWRENAYGKATITRGHGNGAPKSGEGWPLAKSLTGIPTLYSWSLAYGRNLLTGEPSPAGQWRIRNVIVWARPNPPVGALGDKFRPATSYITVACKGGKRYFDLDAVRGDAADAGVRRVGDALSSKGIPGGDSGNPDKLRAINNPAGAPPLDWHADDHPEDGDWLWKLSTQPYKGSHYATYPLALPKRLIEAMCPLKVCTTCGKPSERITVVTDEYAAVMGDSIRSGNDNGAATSAARNKIQPQGITSRQATTTGWTDCGHNDYRTGIVLDPFAGSGTTLEAAQAVGRHAIGIDLDARNADLAQERVGMFLDIDRGAAA